MSNKKPIMCRWQSIIAILIFMCTIILALYMAYRDRDCRRLDFMKLSESAIADLRNRPPNKLRLFYGEEKLSNASIVSFKVVNSGNIHLNQIDASTPEDKENPRFFIQFDPKVRVLTTHVIPLTDKKSTQINRQQEQESNLASFAIELMNTSASIRVDIVVTDYEPSRKVNFEVSGFGLKKRKIPVSGHLTLSWWCWVAIFFGCLLITILLKPITWKLSARLIEKAPWLATAFAIIYKYGFTGGDMLITDEGHRQRSTWAALTMVMTICLNLLVVLIVHHFYNLY